MKQIDEMLSEYAARGGAIKRVAQGARGVSRGLMRDLSGDDDARAQAMAREDYRAARKAERRAARKRKRVKRDYDAQARYDDVHGTDNGYAPWQLVAREC